MILPLGPQNAFVMNQGIRRQYHLMIALLCAISDLLLICAGIFGGSALLMQSPWLLALVTWGGVAFLLWYGFGALKTAFSSNLELASADYQRYQELVSEGAVPQQTFENYRTKYEVAQAALNQAKAGVSKANSALLQTDANQANEAAVAKKIAQAQAVLEQLEVSLDETEIKAPFDGVITAKYVEEGSMISQGTPIVAIQDPTDNWVDLKVPETELSRYALNQQVTLVGRDEKTKVTGTITDISKKAEFATQRATSERGDDSDIISFNVKIQVDSDLLRPGMRFRITNGERS